MNQPNFSHVPYPTDYMDIAVKKVKDHFKDNFRNKKVLDLPAGNGWIGEELTDYGMEVISADINDDKPHFAQVDMEKPLPFRMKSLMQLFVVKVLNIFFHHSNYLLNFQEL